MEYQQQPHQQVVLGSQHIFLVDALCILFQKKELVKNKGILTPVECTGELLINRLEKAGIKFEYF